MITRRKAIKQSALLVAACAAAPAFVPLAGRAADAPVAGFKLPALPYAFDALEPHIDAKTMEIHHDKHHQAYITNLNKALEGKPELSKLSLEELVRSAGRVPADVRTAVRNQGGGHYNHSLFWQMMKKDGGGEPKGGLAKAMDAKFGNFGAFKEAFTKAATTQFGSGWAWLTFDG
ncbi:MAG TPA: superoxide dismutase, partial [Verrucomicrobiae bacterium]